jgi:hypothetical protein
MAAEEFCGSPINVEKKQMCNAGGFAKRVDFIE